MRCAGLPVTRPRIARVRATTALMSCVAMVLHVQSTVKAQSIGEALQKRSRREAGASHELESRAQKRRVELRLACRCLPFGSRRDQNARGARHDFIMDDRCVLVVSIEHCTAVRPTASLKGSAERYKWTAERLEELLRSMLPENVHLSLLINNGKPSTMMSHRPPPVLPAGAERSTATREENVGTAPRIGAFEVEYRVVHGNKIIGRAPVFSKLNAGRWPNANALARDIVARLGQSSPAASSMARIIRRTIPLDGTQRCPAAQQNAASRLRFAAHMRNRELIAAWEAADACDLEVAHGKRRHKAAATRKSSPDLAAAAAGTIAAIRRPSTAPFEHRMHRQPPTLQSVRSQVHSSPPPATPPQPSAEKPKESLSSSVSSSPPAGAASTAGAGAVDHHEREQSTGKPASQDAALVYQRLAAAADAQNGAGGNGTSSVSDILCLRDAPPTASRGTPQAMNEILQQLPPALPLPPESLCAMRRSLREVLKALCRSLASELRVTKANDALQMELEAAV